MVFIELMRDVDERGLGGFSVFLVDLDEPQKWNRIGVVRMEQLRCSIFGHV